MAIIPDSPRFRPIEVHIFIVYSIWKILVNVFIVEVRWSTKHYTQNPVQNIDRSECPLAALAVDVVWAIARSSSL